MDTLDLNIDELCDRSDNPYLEKILSIWKKTNSPFWDHWRKIMRDSSLLGSSVLESVGRAKWFRFGLSTVEEEMSVCRSLYTNDVVKLNIQGGMTGLNYHTHMVWTIYILMVNFRWIPFF